MGYNTHFDFNLSNQFEQNTLKLISPTKAPPQTLLPPPFLSPMLSAQDLIALACDLTADLATEDRFSRLIATVVRLIPCEAAALLQRQGNALVPIAFRGLVPDLAGRRFVLGEHPRLDLILHHPRHADGSLQPVRFPPDSRLPDPYDGLMSADPHACARVHACMGCPLIVDHEVIGVLTVDSRDPAAFDQLDDATVVACAALAAVGMRTASLIAALEHTTKHQGEVLLHLVQDERVRRGAVLLGSSPAMQHLRREIDLVAGSTLTVLITGETGVGKELVAGAIHAASTRRDEPLVQVNCAALPEALAESELFGHLRGSFTGAVADRAGKFEVADGGTLFLDEIGELPASIQPKLLRALQQGDIQRIGSDKIIRVDVRIVAATNRDLVAEQIAGRFRADLYHRLSVYPIHIPPLRERCDDIAMLAGQVIERESIRLGCRGSRLDAAARTALLGYAWPGNVRELEHVVTRALLRAAGGVGHGVGVVIGAEHLALDATTQEAITASKTVAGATGGSLRVRVDDFTAKEVHDVLVRHRRNWTSAARELGLTPSNLQRLTRRLGARAE